jgi:hypothetical protein
MPKITIEWIEQFATRTGSSLIPDYAPNDLDFFALMDEDRIMAIEGQIASSGRWKNKITHNDSIEHWADSFCFNLEINKTKVHLFFVNRRYFKVLHNYTDLIKYMCQSDIGADFLRDKANRVYICEKMRKEEDAESPDA